MQRRRCKVCGASLGPDHEDCPYEAYPVGYESGDSAALARWHLHNCSDDALPGVQRWAQWQADASDRSILRRLRARSRRLFGSEIRIMAIIWPAASLVVACFASPEHRVLWWGLLLLFILPVSVGLWFYQSWARWAAMGGFLLLSWALVSHLAVTGWTIHAIGKAAGLSLAICALLEWKEPRSIFRPSDVPAILAGRHRSFIGSSLFLAGTDIRIHFRRSLV